jgi:transcriptional regulator with XRE-family HTH domain
VIDVATLSVIRRWALREQMSIREISRRTGLARNTVKKYLRAGDEEPRYAKRASSSKLDPYAEKLSTWLSIEATKSRKQRRTLLQLHTPSLKRRKRSTYPHRKLLCSYNGWVSIRWKSRVRDQCNSTLSGLLHLRLGFHAGSSSSDGVHLNLALEYEVWNGKDVRLLSGFESLVTFFRALKQHRKFQLEVFTFSGTRMQQTVTLAAHEDFVDSHAQWLNFVFMVRRVASTYNLSIPLSTEHPPGREEYLAMVDCLEILDGRKTSQYARAEPMTFSVTLSNDQYFLEKELMLEVEYKVSAPTRFQVFGHEITLPTRVLYARSPGTLERYGQYKSGESARVTMNMGLDSEFRYFFEDACCLPLKTDPVRAAISIES